MIDAIYTSFGTLSWAGAPMNFDVLKVNHAELSLEGVI